MPPSSSTISQNFKGLLVLISFCVVSSAIIIHNKFLLDRKSGVFPHSMVLMWLQTVTAFLTLSILKATRVLTFEVEWRSMGDVVTGVLYVISVFSGMLSLSFVTIPIFSTLKRCGLIVSWTIEYFFARKLDTTKTLPPLFLMLVGITLAGSTDLNFNFVGYFLGFLSCVSACSSFELSRRVSETKNKGVWAVLMVNSVVTLCLLTPYLLWCGELQKYGNPFSWTNRQAMIHVPLNCAFCFLLNFLIFQNVAMNSPLVHVVSGNVKTILTTVLGALLMDSHLTFIGWCGIFASAAGAFWFTLLKNRYRKVLVKTMANTTTSLHHHNAKSIHHGGNADVMLLEIVTSGSSSSKDDHTKVV